MARYRSSVLEVVFIRGETMEVCILPGESYPLAFLLISMAVAWLVKKHLEVCNLKSDILLVGITFFSSTLVQQRNCKKKKKKKENFIFSQLHIIFSKYIVYKYK